MNVSRRHGPVARNMMNGWIKMGTPVIFVAPLEPFIHKEYAAAVDTLINTYGINEYTTELVIKGIIGEISFNDRLVAHD